MSRRAELAHHNQRQTYLPAVGRDTRNNISAVIQNRYSTPERLPNMNHNLSYDGGYHPIPQEIEYPGHHSVIQEYDEAERQYPRSQSFVPQHRPNLSLPPVSQTGGVHSKKLASMLLDQIKIRDQQKKNEKLQNRALEKKLLQEGGDYHFYKHHGNDPKEKYINKALGLTNNENRSRRHYITAPTGPSPEKYITTGHDNSIDLEEPEEEFYNIQQPDQGPLILPPVVPERNDTVRKIEYQKALEKQVLEKKLQKKHDKEVNALQDKLEDLKNANYWLQVQNVVAKPQQPKTVFGNANDPFYQPIEGNAVVKTTQRPLGSLKKIQTAQNTRPLKSRATDRQISEMTDEYSPPRMKPVPTGDPFLMDYLQIQDEITKMKSDLKANMNNMTEKLVDLKYELSSHPKKP